MEESEWFIVNNTFDKIAKECDVNEATVHYEMMNDKAVVTFTFPKGVDMI